MAKWWSCILFILFFFCQGTSFAAEGKTCHKPSENPITPTYALFTEDRTPEQDAAPSEGWLSAVRHLSVPVPATSRTNVKRCMKSHPGTTGYVASPCWHAAAFSSTQEYGLPVPCTWKRDRRYYLYHLRHILI